MMNLPERFRDAAWAMHEFERSEYLTLAVNGEDGFPYAVPMCTVRIGDDLFFHTALLGHLNDLLAKDGRVCLTCVNHTALEPEQTTMRYRSAIAIGEAQLVINQTEREEVAKCFLAKYLPAEANQPSYAERMARIALIYRVKVKSITGKESK